MLVQALRIAPDDARHRIAPGLQPVVRERAGDVVHVLEQGALGDQGGGGEHLDQPEMGDGAGGEGDGAPHRQRQRRHQHHQHHAAGLAIRLGQGRLVQLLVQPRDQAADDDHRMGQQPEQRPHLAEHGVQGERHEEDQKGVGRVAEMGAEGKHGADFSVW